MSIKIALAGNPNCGKTTLFNELTGSNQYVGNWPGVTVEKKDGVLKGYKDVIIQDLPGIYSLSPYTLEEVVTRKYLVNDKPDAIINIIDGTNIERNLYLTTQLLELNIPIVVAINMMDLVTRHGDKIDLEKLATALHCSVMPLSASTGEGCKEVAEKAIEIAKSGKEVECPHVFSGSVEHAIAHIEESIDNMVDKKSQRWFSVKIFERDEKVLEEVKLPADLYGHLEEHIKECELEMDDEADSIITNQRYSYIQAVISRAVKKKALPNSLTMSDRVDQIVTNRILALPIFAIVIWLMYWISVSTVGTWMTDWANNGVFGEGWFLAWTQDCSWFTSKEVKERNAAAQKAFDSKDALVVRNRKIAASNAKIRASWHWAEAQAWAEGKELPNEPDYTNKEKNIAFEPETWEKVSGDFADASLRVDAFQAAYANAVANPAEFRKGLEAAYKASSRLVERGTALFEAEQDKAIASEYLALLKADAAAKAAKLDLFDKNIQPKLSEKDDIIIPELAQLINAPVYFEDRENGIIQRTEYVDYAAYLENKDAIKDKPNPAKYGLWVPGIPGLVETVLDKVGTGPAIKSLVLDGIIGGVGTVFGFLPQIMIVFLFLAFLEDCGYMSRVAFIMDRIFRRFGLSGKSFIPMLVGAGCGVPAVMATRTIDNLNDRRMTIILATFVPCGAKVAVIAMIVGAFFPGSNWVGPSMYFLGIAIVIVGGLSLKKTSLFSGDTAHFVMELPAYHMPSAKNLFLHTWERGKGYAIKAGTVIFAACVLLWLLMNFNWTFHLINASTADGLEQCMLHDIGQCFAWIFRPLGFGTWQGAVASMTAEIAKEQATATLAIMAPDVGGGTLKGIQALFLEMVPAAITAPELRILYSKLIAFSFLVCNLFFPPCIVATIATWREMGSAKWGLIAICFQLLVGYCLSLVCFRLGVFFFADVPFGIGQIAALLVVAFILFAVFRPDPNAKKVVKEK
ncbi:MAG: ferrous iron transporter B [Victivallales bacterium]|nr:ferrous iron transporter B [Victivallales bacterium]